MMYCEKCGTALRPEAQFCASCGQKRLVGDSPLPAIQPAMYGTGSSSPPQNSSPTSQNEQIIGLGLVIVGAISLIFGIVRLNSIQSQLAGFFGTSDPKAWILVIAGVGVAAVGAYLMLPAKK